MNLTDSLISTIVVQFDSLLTLAAVYFAFVRIRQKLSCSAVVVQLSK